MLLMLWDQMLQEAHKFILTVDLLYATICSEAPVMPEAHLLHALCSPLSTAVAMTSPVGHKPNTQINTPEVHVQTVTQRQFMVIVIIFSTKAHLQYFCSA